MKKLLALSYLLLVATISVVTANPAVLFLQMPVNYMLLGLGVNTSAITSFAEQNQAALIATLLNDLDIANDITVQPNVKNRIPLPRLQVAGGLRPYSSSEEFKPNELNYTNRFLTVTIGKRDLLIDIEAYRNTYYAWNTGSGSGATKKEVPFENFVWDQIMKGYKRDINDETAWLGFDGSVTAAYAPATVYTIGQRMRYTPTTNNPRSVQEWFAATGTTVAGNNPDSHPNLWRNVTARAVGPGLESYILTEIAASNITPFATGVVNATAGVAISAFKRLFRSLPIPYQNYGSIISCSFTDWYLLLDDLSAKYQSFKDNIDINNNFIVMPETGNKLIVKPASWLGTSRRLVAGPTIPGQARHQNLYMGTDLLSDANEVAVKDSDLWTLKVGIKMAMGFQIQDLAAIRVGDQA